MSEHVKANESELQMQALREEPGQLESAGVANPGALDVLHQAIGNRGVGRIAEAQRAALHEGLTPVPPWQQERIDSLRGGGSELPGAPGVRLHTGPAASSMAMALNARAFTQGRDVFLGAGYDPATEAGRATLAHELTHVAQGRTEEGAVQREGEAGATSPPAEERYTITMSDGVRENLTKEQAIGLLSETAATQQRALDQYSGEWAETNKGRLSFFGAIGGALTDVAGMAFPSYEETWKDADNAMLEVRKALRGQDVKATAEHLKTANDAYKKGNDKWSAYKSQLDSAAVKAQVGIVVAAVVAVAVIATAGAVLAPAGAAGGAGGAGAAGAGGMGIAGAGGGGVGAGGGIAGGTVATGAGAGAGAGGGTVIMGGAPTIAAGAGGGAGAAGAGAAGGTVAAGTGAGAGGGTVILGGAPTIAAGAGGGAAGAGGGAVVGGGAAAGAGGGAVVGGGVGGSVATGATIPGVAAGAGSGGAVGAGTIAGVTEGGAVAEGLAQQATGVVVRAVAAEGAAGGAAVAEGMSVWTLEAVLARLSVAIAANAPFTSQEAQLLKRAFDIVNEVWKRKAGLPGGAP